MTLSFHIPAHFFSIFCLLYTLSKLLSKPVFTNHCFQRDFLIESSILISFYVTYCSFPNPIYSFPLVYLFPIGFPYFSVAFSHLLPPCWLPFMPCTHSHSLIHLSAHLLPPGNYFWKKSVGPRDFIHCYNYPPVPLPFPSPSMSFWLNLKATVFMALFFGFIGHL